MNESAVMDKLLMLLTDPYIDEEHTERKAWLDMTGATWSHKSLTLRFVLSGIESGVFDIRCENVFEFALKESWDRSEIL